MTRQTWVYPSDGGEPYIKGTEQDLHLTMVHGDLPDFQSSVDGKWYSGRAGMREHCLKNNVVPHEDTKGLPTLMTNSDIRSSAEKRRYVEDRKGRIIHEVYSKLRDQL